MSAAHAPDHIDVIERTLRGVIHDVLSERFGPGWAQDESAGLGPDWSAGLARKAEEDRKVQAPNAVYDVPLSYAEFRDLGALLKKHKKLFVPIFADWETMLAHLRVAETLRNAIQHNRDIAPSQRALLEGIAGEIQDAVDRFRIGTSLRAKRTILRFRDGFSVEGGTEDRVLKEAAERVRWWQGRILEAARASSLNLEKARSVEEEEFQYAIHVGHVEASIWTQPSPAPTSEIRGAPHKDLFGELKYTATFRHADTFLELIGKPYHYIAYELENKLDIKALKGWSAERAGLDPSSSGAMNGVLESVDYSMFAGRLRIGAVREVERAPKSGGALSATAEPPDAFWRAHELMRPEQLMGFMVGDVAPRAMMHLVEMARRP